MANPFLPLWEYIPDGEPRVFGDRVYIYGSHDRPSSPYFCDYKYKVWSAPLNDLNNWQCHGDSFHTLDDDDHKSDTPWTDRELYACDVVEHKGKYYLYSYILNSKGCVSVSDKPEGPFKLVSTYKYDEADAGDDGIFNDPGVLVDDDGRVYIYYGFTKSHFGEIDPENMYEIKKGSYRCDMMPEGEGETDFFEASSIRKINGRYYFIYSPREGHRLDYAVSDFPWGPFERKGTIVDNGKDYPAGNNHGSLCCINGQWYIFYHRMTNNSIMSRRACAEPVEILPDGTIPEVEMTSLGFEKSLNPYRIVPADIACVLKGDCFVTELDRFTRVISSIKKGSIIGYKYFDFGEDYSSKTMNFSMKIRGTGCVGRIRILIDDYENGEEIGVCETGASDGVYSCRVKNVTGRHSVFFVAEHIYDGWYEHAFKDRSIFELEAFSFMK
ncbi:MAG: family 43 glycosylhydrolase [Ruminococcus sp.]|nr:family 43 glycosylhydrolase [Ruminococcus sp.]